MSALFLINKYCRQDDFSKYGSDKINIRIRNPGSKDRHQQRIWVFVNVIGHGYRIRP